MKIRRKHLSFLLFLSILYSSFIFQNATAEEQSIKNDLSSATYMPGEVLIRFKSDIKGKQIIQFRSAMGLISIGKAHVREKGEKIISRIRIPDGLSVQEAIEKYRRDPAVDHVQPNYLYHFRSISSANDPFFSNQWGFQNTGQEINSIIGTQDADIDVTEAWEVTTGSTDVIVAVIDSGIAYNHPDLSENIWMNTGEIAGDGIDNDGNGYIDDIRGWDFYDNDNDPMDKLTNAHGTHIAGVIGAIGNNGVGIAGINWEVSLMALKISSDQGTFGDTYIIEDAIDYAIQNGAHIINASWGGAEHNDQILYDAIQTAGNNGLLFMSATGNAGEDADMKHSYPDGFDLANIVAVTASDQNDDLATINIAGAIFSSNYGFTSVDVAAPGVNIFSTSATDYDAISGTSIANAFVSGLAALVLSEDPDLTVLQLKEILINAVDKTPGLQSKIVSEGRINAIKALGLLSAIGYSPQQISFTATKGDSNPTGQTLQIWNSKNGILNWYSSCDADWLTISPSAGSSTGETDNIQVTPDISGLDTGTFNATLTIHSSDSVDIYQNITVTLVINAPQTSTSSGGGGGGGCFIDVLSFDIE